MNKKKLLKLGFNQELPSVFSMDVDANGKYSDEVFTLEVSFSFKENNRSKVDYNTPFVVLYSFRNDSSDEQSFLHFNKVRTMKQLKELLKLI